MKDVNERIDEILEASRQENIDFVNNELKFFRNMYKRERDDKDLSPIISEIIGRLKERVNRHEDTKRTVR